MWARSTTPYALLSDAVSILNVRSQLRQRFRTGADRALANVDVFLEMSRAYDVRGLRAFAREMRGNWEEAVRQIEGRPDAEEQSAALITIHAAKGLEWAIVIPINMTGAPKADSGLMHDRRSQQFSTPILGVEPPSYADMTNWNAKELARERVRLWYVAATRARDLLVLPRHSSVLANGAWARLVEFDLQSLPSIEPESLGSSLPPPAVPLENLQNGSRFAEEAASIAQSHRRIEWRQPSRSEMGTPAETSREPIFNRIEFLEEPRDVQTVAVVGSATRGILLHKLMEEVLGGEIGDDLVTLEARALQLVVQLSVPPSDSPSEGIAPREIAQTVARTLSLPEIAEIRSRLVPEYTVYGSHESADSEIIVSGIADAVVYDAEGRIELIVDWKSDVEILAERLTAYRAQLDTYRRETGAQLALLVLMTSAQIIPVGSRRAG